MTNQKEKLTSKYRSLDILVLATMSAGKTTFINAMIGEDFLHTANEATTACITTLVHNNKANSTSACCYSHNGELLEFSERVQAEQLKEWNKDHRIRNIVLQGRFRTYCKPTQDLALHDTPGPNNSQDSRHAQLTMSAIQTIPFDILVYILNATQLGTHDDRAMLEMVKKKLAHHQRAYKIIFILNKIDQLDHEKGESPEKLVEQASSYLVNIGFTNPIIVPMSANAALYARKKAIGAPLTRKQRLELDNFRDANLHEKRALNKSSRVPKIIKKKVLQHIRLNTRGPSKSLTEDSEHHLLMAYSGLTTVAIMINRQRTKLKKIKT